MNKKQLFKTLNFTDRDEVIQLSDKLEGKYSITSIKAPQKTLTMLKIRESAKNTLFYAGEALSCECTVQLEGTKGYGAALGDDLEKVYAMAVIDAALNANLPEQVNLTAIIKGWENKLFTKHAADAQIALSTKVNFNVMEE
jgi:alpha-D-ribose 1-methylphosphonate 5-triphosphate synthase subunit PhnG